MNADQDVAPADFAQWQQEMVPACTMHEFKVDGKRFIPECGSTAVLLVTSCCSKENACVPCYTKFIEYLARGRGTWTCTKCKTRYKLLDRMVRAVPL